MQLVGLCRGSAPGVIFFRHGRDPATTTKRDFSFMGKFPVSFGMIAPCLVANDRQTCFLQIPGARAWTISTLVIVVFSLFLLYDP